MRNLVILKLGGSIITRKQEKRPVIRAELIRKIGKTLKKAWNSGRPAHLILLAGAGSFGHPLAHRYRLMDAKLNRDTLSGFAETTIAMRTLGNELARILLRGGLPVIPLQLGACADQAGTRVRIRNFSALDTILRNHGIPLLSGDVLLRDKNRTAIASADVVAVLLARHFKARTLLFASDVSGVYDVFPPPSGARPRKTMTRSDVKAIAKRKIRVSRDDVTGKMVGKLRTLLKLKDARVVIFDGRTAANLRTLSEGRKMGTEIRL